MQWLLLVTFALPLLGAAVPLLMKKASPRAIAWTMFGIIAATGAFVWWTILAVPAETVTLARFSDRIVLAFRLDGAARIFAGLVAALWPVTALYAVSYMRDEERLPLFFSFFTLSFPVTLGIAFSANIFTMYCFYEMLTLATFPLVLHPMTHNAVKATVRYVLFSLGGAALGFASMMYLMTHGGDGLFTLGGLDLSADGPALLFFFFGFLGFGVKAAVFPVHLWLPTATVAPTPVTALLHAVAVVKAGAFALIRLGWYAYGPTLLAGTWAQYAALGLCIFTVFFGSYMAIREQHWKRRLAYSTISNISYILFGVYLLTEVGLTAGILHMLNHSVIKILAFFCAGAVLKKASVTDVGDLGKLNGAMPVTAACFTVSAIALTGIPPFGGFVSKWKLLVAGFETDSPLALAGSIVLIVSALFTAVYMLLPATSLCFPARRKYHAAAERNEADACMTVPMLLLAAACLLTGIFGQSLIDLIQTLIFG